MSKVIILGTSGNYAASTTSSTANTATNPNILLAGTVGIYGLNGVDADTSGNTDKFVLITSATSATGKTQDSTFVSGGGQNIRIVQGTSTDAGVIGTADINRLGIKSILKKAYTAPKHQVQYIGYDGASGKLNLPTFATGDTATVFAVENLVSTGDKIRNQETFDAGTILSSSTTYGVLASLAYDCNSQPTGAKTNTCFITHNGSVADWTGTGTLLKLTKGSTTAEFYIQDATDGVTASTGTIAAGDVINLPSSNYRSFSFTANILGTGAGRTIIVIGSTVYNVADAGSAAQNATAIAAAINAGTQATAVVTSSTTVTITLKGDNYMARPLVTYTADDAAWTIATLTIVDGETLPVIYKASAAVSAAASFELDYAYQGETGYFVGGTTAASNAGIATSITEYGLKFVVDTSGKVYGYAVQGDLENATMSTAVGSSVGNGTYAEVNAVEKAELAYRGQFDTVDRRAKYVPVFAVDGTLYDTYCINYVAPNDQTTQVTNTNIENTLYVYFPVSHSAESEFETIIKVLAPQAAVNF